MTVDRCRGQALVELAVVLPLLLLLGCGAVAVVQAARTQMALATIADASALVAARAPDALQACEAAHLELTTVLAQSRGLLPGPVTDRLDGLCVGPPPDPQSLLAPPGSGSYSIWFGYGGEDDSFCRVGSAPSAGQPTDGEVVATLA
ncbi:MAG: TadE/TadG family type IV pilus assembly protein, partial [Candidatus Dormibacteria bacterium]